MITLGLVVAIGLPLGVAVWAAFWPEPADDEHSVETIRRRIDDEDTQ